MRFAGIYAVVASLFAAETVAQGAWQVINPPGPARFTHAMAYDSARGRTVVFGGSQDGMTALNDTWEWDGASWTQVATSGPPGRWNHAMAYDAQRGVVVMFGGNSSQGYFGDTWTWNGSTWQQVASGGPSPRTAPAAAYDSVRGRVVLFGGGDNSGQFGDTWEWNGTTWIPMLLATGPAPRTDHTLAFDSLRARTVMFGGTATSDTWEWNGLQWSLRSQVGPLPRSIHAMAFESRVGLTVLHGGLAAGGVALVDTWAWNGTAWTMLSAPAFPRYWHEMVFHEQTGQLLMFGGAGATGDVVAWVGTLPSASPYGVGCGNPALELAGSQTALPRLNSVATATVSNAPTPFAAILVGWRNDFYGPFALPASLVSLGMDGCDLLQSAEIQWLPTSPAGPGTFDFNLPLPNTIGFVGGSLYLQAFSYAPGFNPAGVILSNGLHWVVGW